MPVWEYWERHVAGKIQLRHWSWVSHVSRSSEMLASCRAPGVLWGFGKEENLVPVWGCHSLLWSAACHHEPLRSPVCLQPHVRQRMVLFAGLFESNETASKRIDRCPRLGWAEFFSHAFLPCYQRNNGDKAWFPYDRFDRSDRPDRPPKGGTIGAILVIRDVSIWSQGSFDRQSRRDHSQMSLINWSLAPTVLRIYLRIYQRYFGIAPIVQDSFH